VDNPIYNIWILFSDKKEVHHFNDLEVISDDGEEISITRLNGFLNDIGFNKRINKIEGYKNVK